MRCKEFLLCLILAVSFVTFGECKSRGRSHGSHSRGSHSHGSYSSHSHSSHSYPASHGYSGGSSGGSHSYPASNGHSGYGSSSSHSYPASNGHSGYGSGSSHSYPGSNGYSGYGSGSSHSYSSGHGSGSSHTYPSSHGYSGSGSRHQSWGAPHVPSYYTSPQHVYVTQYRNSDSQYSNLLTGLTMYNLGRSHGHHHHHYYSDDYYRSSTRHRDSNTEEVTPEEEAICFLRISRNNKEDVLKIPCAIVSTFGSGDSEIRDVVSNQSTNNCSSFLNAALDDKLLNGNSSTKLTNATIDDSSVNATLDNNNTLSSNSTNLNATANMNETLSNMTAICNGTVAVEDPLAVKGAPVDVEDMKCSIEIRARITGQDKIKVTRNNVDCNILLQQARLQVPENKKSKIMPSRENLKSMLDRPPWWFGILFAV